MTILKWLQTLGLAKPKPLTLEEAFKTMSDEEAQRTIAPLTQEQENTVRAVLMEEQIPLSSNSHVTVYEYRAALVLLQLRGKQS